MDGVFSFRLVQRLPKAFLARRDGQEPVSQPARALSGLPGTPRAGTGLMQKL
jgi:hypothetical protein